MVAGISAMMIMATTTTALAQTADRTFESEEDGFRLQVPQGWVIEDHDNTSFESGSENIAMLCLENEALPGLGGEYNCQAADVSDRIIIDRWSDLQSMPEFQNESDDGSNSSNIIPTSNDLVALWIQVIQNDTSDIRIENTTDVNEFTKIVNMTYTYHDNAGTFLPFDDFSYGAKSSLMFVLSQDRNTGYAIANILSLENQTQRHHSPAVQEVFNSFELLT